MYSGSVRPAILYDRKIRYLDYYENGQRSKGVGFIKLERRDELCNISLQINGLYRKDRFSRPLILIGKEEKELCRLQLAEGGIKTYFEGLNSLDLGGQGVPYEELTGIRIPISTGREIRCTWEMPKEEPPDRRQPEKESAGKEEMSGTAAEEALNDEMANVEMPDGEATEEKAGGEYQEKTKEIVSEPLFKEDKWEQLCAIYPHVHPFSDEREFLSLGLSDFVLLHSKSYKLVYNSFLLHGYYNYHHLILMRAGKRNYVRYYVGVPGNLYEREKKTAVMFGFEGFECAKEPAEEGDFGYYLIPVEL